MNPKKNIDAIYPLTPMQQGMLFHTLLDPESGVYLEQMSCVLAGGLDAQAFVNAWSTVTQRHEVLRAAFVWQDVPRPLQVIGREVQPAWTREDLGALAPPARQARLDEYTRGDRAAGFKLGRAPLMRFALFRLGPDEHHFVWTFHHIVMDGWCLPIVLGEVIQAYAASFGAGRPLPPSPRYGSYVAWLQKQDASQAERFWRQRLDGFTAPTALPPAEADGDDATLAGSGAREVRVHLAADVSAALQAAARAERVTINTLFQGAWGWLLARMAGTREAVFGVTVSGRPPSIPGIESMVGLFINTLPLRVELKADAPVGTWLRELQAQAAEAQAFEHIPLSDIQRWSGVPAGQALFQSVLVFENFPIAEGVRQRSHGLEVRDLRFQQQTGLPLTLTVMPGQRITLRGACDGRSVDVATVESLLARLQRVVGELAADPSRRVGAIRALGEEEWGRQVVEWNATGVAFDGSVSLAEAIERQCARTPRATAVVGSDGRLSFAELDARAARLASRLRASGVARGGFVGLCVERDARVVVGVLGILKAGAAYVPIEPGSPRERVGYVVRDAGLRVVVSTPGSRGTVDHPGVEVVGLEDEGGVPCECVATGAGDAAYVLYTSGSTGQPKGVVVEQGAVWNYIRGIEARLGLEAGESWAMVQPLSVDSSVTALYPGLVSGGTVHVIGPEIALDGAALDAYLTREDVACLKIAPSHLMALQREARVMPSRRLVFGGEGAQPQWAAELAQRRAGCRVWNHYGPTETTVGVTTYEVQAGAAPRRGATVPIGRPLPNSRAYVLDEEFDPVPVGVVGELYIGGAGLARGYVGRADLTAERFVPDVFGGEGGRLYRTGDLARFLSDGNLEFLGRRDHQVKVRGYRIELGEIEAVLREHGGVREAVVEAREDVPGEKRLVGYVVPREAGRGPSASELRAHVKERLPEYMVPSAWVELGELPRTAHGKLDRKALPVPATAGVERRGYEEPRTEVERTLCRIWEEVLRVPRVGVRDNFFELGGDSILSIQIVSRARAEGLQLVVKQLFQRQTVAELAEVAEPVGAAEGVEAGVVTGRVELTPIQRWFFEQEWAEPWHFNQSVLLESRESVSEAGLRAVVSELLKHHDALRTCYRRVDGEWEQELVETAGEAVVVESVADSSELERRCAEWQTRFDLERGPLLRVVLFRMSGQRDRVLLVAHHLVVDGVSWRVLLEDVERGYAQWSRGEALELGAKTASFKRWSERLKEHAASEAVQAQWEYWERQCAHGEGAVPGLEGEEAGADGVGVVSVRLDEDATRALLSEVPGVYGTRINDVLLLGLVEAAGVETEAGAGRGVRVELEGHGREESVGLDVSRTVGWFTTQYPLWLEVQAGADIGSKLKAVKEQVRQVPEAGLGYGLLKYWGGDEERARRLEPGRGGISFNYLGQLDAALPSDGLLQPAAESKGAARSAKASFHHDWVLTAHVVGGELRTTLSFRAARHTREQAQALLAGYLDVLRAVVRHGRRPGVGGYTPSDFPLAKLDQATLDRLFGGPRAVEDVYPLSPMQEGLLFHSLQRPESGVYLEQMSCTFEGDFDVEAFERAWQDAMQRHAILRTAFLWEGLERPLQVVSKRVPVPLTREDWTGAWSDDEAGRQRLAELFETERARAFDLRQAPAFRLKVLALAPDRHHLVWSYHHILHDGWSGPLLLKDVIEAYVAAGRGQAPRGTPAAAFRDYIAWLERQDQRAAEHFWRQEVGDIESPTALPGVAGEPVEAESAYDILRLRLNAEETTRVQDAARRHHVTLNTLTQAAWALLIARYTHQRDVLFGATLSGRPADLPGSTGTVGLFINSLPVRVRIAPDQRVLDWLRALQERQAEARQYDYAPLLQVQSWTRLRRGVPLFESLLIFENYPVETSLRDVQGPLRISGVRSKEQTNFALTVEAVPSTEFSLRIGYDGRRFTRETVESMLAHLRNALLNIADGIEGRVGALDVLTPAERRASLAGGRGPAREAAPALLDAWAQQARARGDALALEAGASRWSYAELDRRSNSLARHLREAGVGPERVVALCCGRTAELVLGILGVWKAGAAWVVLDDKQPDERWRFMLADAGARHVLCVIENVTRVLGVAEDARVVMLDAEWDEIAQQGDEPLRTARHEDSLAYVVYTSGSSGEPKGVMVRDGALANHAREIVERYGLGSDQRRLQVVSPGFDAFGEELVPLLCSGGTLVMGLDVSVLAPAELMSLAARERISAMHIPPSYWHALVEDLRRRGVTVPDELKLVVVGAESPSPERLAEWAELAPRGSRWINAYGPAEATITATAWEADLEDRAALRALGRVPVGRAIGNVSVYVLGGDLEPVPLGVAGELFIGGAGLARGYLGRPDLTAERFVPDPFGPVGGRLYRTGDVARFRAADGLEFLGRRDQQIKLRGYRIELGEIETALRLHPEVSEVAVMLREDAPGEPRLVGYLVAREAGHAPTPAELRRHLKGRLPDYMLPSAWVELDRLPLTPHGKLDRRALAAPAPGAEGADYEEPRSELERTLARIWSEVLRVPRVGLRDNFFELGGHSLLATQVASRIQEALGSEFRLSLLFEKPTIGELAPALEDLVRAEAGAGAEIDSLLRDLNALPEAEARALLEDADASSPQS